MAALACCCCLGSNAGIAPTCTTYDDMNKNSCNIYNSCTSKPGACSEGAKPVEQVKKPVSDDPALDKAFSGFAEMANEKLNPAGFTGDDALAKMIGRVIGFFAAGIGSIALALYVWAGFMWMTASGNSERVGKAQGVIMWTSLGAVAILSSYIIVRFIFDSLAGNTTGALEEGKSGPTSGSACVCVGDMGIVCHNIMGTEADCKSGCAEVNMTFSGFNPNESCP